MSLSIGSYNANYGTVQSSAAYSTSSLKNLDTVTDDKNSEISAETSSAAASSSSEDTVEISNQYTVDVDSLIEQNNQRIQDFTSKLMSMVTKQGEQSNLSLFGMNLTVTPQESAEAADSIAEGGEWSVNAVADRIMNMAYALSGGDESKLQTLKDAVLEGFKQAGFDSEDRSTMPAITGQTYDEILKRFDEWETTGMKTYDTNHASSSQSSKDSASSINIIV
jgi:hypothetical protein